MASSSSTSKFPQRHKYKYDVFLSFRGEDTRGGFTSHLYKELCLKKIETYIDNNRLESGDEISSTLFKAIEDSKVLVVVFSENYASSSWCLNEVSHIYKCNQNNGQFVVPVFYKVDPSDVRKQKGSYAKAFASHQRSFKATTKVEEWKVALTGIANLSGFHSKNWSNEAEYVTAVVESIKNKLEIKSLPTRDPKGLVGIEVRVKHIIEALLSTDEDVRIVGITGMGGIGKTTLAKSALNRLSSKFEECLFLSNVREEVERNGLHPYLEKIRKLSLDKDCHRHNKVLIVLDDVHHLVELLDFIKEEVTELIGHGSRIIITTRDVHVVRELSALEYAVWELNRDEALELFHLNSKSPTVANDKVSSKIVECAQGNPLVIKVLASSLSRCTDETEVDSALDKLKVFPHMQIHDVLKVSYDGLDDEEKEIFLDLACFFKGIEKNKVKRILEGLGFHAAMGMRVLEDKCLISMKSNFVQMHDMIQEMGRRIVRKKSTIFEEPGTWTRLWNANDIQHVLQENTGTASIKGIILDMSMIARNFHISPTAFEKMSFLRFLKIHRTGLRFSEEYDKMYISEGLHSLPGSIRHLYWEEYPLKSLGLNIANNLVDLLMPQSHVEYLWNGAQPLPTLKMIDLNHSKHLIQVPDLSKAPNVEFINLECCTSLIQEPSQSFHHLERLEYLRIGFCDGIINLGRRYSVFSSHNKPYHFGCCSNISNTLLSPRTRFAEEPSSTSSFQKFLQMETRNSMTPDDKPFSSYKLMETRLKYSYISKCLSINNFPKLALNIKELYMNGASIKEVPSSIGYLSCLRIFDLTNCKELETLPITICKLTSLEVLSLYGCLKFETFPEIWEPMVRLRIIYLDGTAIRKLPYSIQNIWGLERLTLTMCEQLQLDSYGMHVFRYLEVLAFYGSNKLGQFPFLFSYSLRYLDLSDCNLSEIPDIIFCFFVMVRALRLNGNLFETIPPSIKNLSQLDHLCVNNCKRLKSFPDLPPALQAIYAENCVSLALVPSFDFNIELFWKKSNIVCNDVAIMFSNCLRMDQNAIDSITDHAKIVIHAIATRFKDRGFLLPSTHVCYPGNKIPSWFEICDADSKLELKFMEIWMDNSFPGFCLSAVVELKDGRSIFESEFQLQCKFSSQNGDQFNNSIPIRPFQFSNLCNTDGNCRSDHVLIWHQKYSLCQLFTGIIREAKFTEASFEFTSVDKDYCKVKKFGICPIYV